MADERSRSPLPGAESLAKPADPDRQIHTQLEDIQRLLHQHTGRLNALDQRSAHTKDQLQKQQQLEASKQAIISSWPDSSTHHDRQKAVERLVEKEGLRNMYVCTQTLKAKGGISHFSIVEFYTKDARDEFLDMVKRDMLTCHGQIQVGRAQIPKYQREADQPFRCAIAVYAQLAGKQERYKPIWELASVWHKGEWIIIVEPAEHDKTQLTIYVRQQDKDMFTPNFKESWQKWGVQPGMTRKPDAYRAQDHYTITIQGLTPEKAAEYDGKYEAQTTRKQGAHSGTKKEDQEEPMDDNAHSGTAHHRRGVRPPQAREGGKGRVSKDAQ